MIKYRKNTKGTNMKYLFLILCTLSLSHAIDESKQLQVFHPLQNEKATNEILQEMQSNIQLYLYQTPLSSYEYFDKKSTSFKSESLITWIHGDVYTQTIGFANEPFVHVTLNNEKNAHLGDYRYDMFTLLSDLLLKMQEDSDFSGSKEKAILGTFFDGYFSRIQNPKAQCPSIDDALVDVKSNELLRRLTRVQNNQRYFNIALDTVSKVDSKPLKHLKQQMNKYLLSFNLLPIKDIAKDQYGNYLFLCEGKTTNMRDDIIFTASLSTIPVSYHVNPKMKRNYHSKTRTSKVQVVSSFNQTNYAGHIQVQGKQFFVNMLNASLSLEPTSEKTREYKAYASALGHTLAGFHSNPDLLTCKTFSKNINKHVKQRVLKTELIAMVYSYNETLEEKWENFTDQEFLSVK